MGKHPTRFADVDDARNGFHEHRDFLIASMLEGQEGLDWTGTPIMKYFQLHFPVRNAPIDAKLSIADCHHDRTMSLE